MPRKNTQAVKQRLVAQFGGECQKCGYSRSLRALQFHHLDASEKANWGGRGGTSFEEVEAHPERFMLLCANCHFVEHERLDAERRAARMVSCQSCGKAFVADTARLEAGRDRFCSSSCRHAQRRINASDPNAIKTRLLAQTREVGECLIWAGRLNAYGRPAAHVITPAGTKITREVQRVVYEAEQGGKIVRFRLVTTCGNPLCVRADHIAPKYPDRYLSRITTVST